MSLKDELYKMTTQGYDNSLYELIKIAGIKPAPTKKENMVNALNEVLSKEENIVSIWKSLSTYEKEVLEEYIITEGNPDYRELDELVKKYKVNNIDQYRFFGLSRYLSPNSKGKLFFINGAIPEEIMKVLKKFVKDIEIKYTPVEIELDEESDTLLCIGESFEEDFINVIRLINTQKLRAVKVSRLPSKQSVIKISKVIKNEDLMPIDEIRVIEDTTRIYGISSMLMSADIIISESETLKLGDKAKEFLKEDTAEKCHRLLESYIDSSINEIQRIKEIKVTGENYSGLKSCRKLIIDFISKAPVNEWVKTEEIIKLIKKTNNRFLENSVGDIRSYSYDDEYRYQRNQGWEEIEGRLIEVMMLEYLSAIGIVDAVVSIDETDYGDEYYRVSCFRLTPLGAYVLGVSNDYKVLGTSENSKLIVHDDLTLSITEGKGKELHAVFLDSIAEKLEETRYAVTFKSIAKALDEDISVREIIDYIIENSEDYIPEEALSSLIKFEENSKRIKIRTIVVVEVDSSELYKELSENKAIMGKIKKEVVSSFEIHSKNVNNVKRQLEKKGYFCVIEDK